MNVHLATDTKGFVSSPVIGNMIIITLCVATFLFSSNFGVKVYAQENNTLILEDIRAILRDEQRDISSIRNTSSAELEASIQMELATSKLEAQGAYTALSVFLLGSGLVIFGLRLTIRSSRYIGKYFTLMVWALTVPVCILIGLFQYGIITGNNLLASFVRNEEPFSLRSFLLYVPIGIVIFLLLAQKRIIHAQATQAAQAQGSNPGKKDTIQELEKLASLKQQGLITDEDFQKFKTRLLTSI